MARVFRFVREAVALKALFRRPIEDDTMATTVPLQDGDALLVIVRDGAVAAHTRDIALSHAEFVRRTLGELPAGAWVGTIRKTDGEVIPFNSRTFYGNQLPAPEQVVAAVRAMFR
jgi:hypothetical protein